MPDAIALSRRVVGAIDQFADGVAAGDASAADFVFLGRLDDA